MAVVIEQNAPTRLRDAKLEPRGPVHPSPISWRDQVLYFLMPDRFSDGREGQRELFNRSQPGQFRAADKQQWMEAGKKFQGGNLRGIASKLDYLRGLGVTALWIGPIWKQRPDLETYHGYGIQNFLDIDQRFGTRQELRDLVDAAHERGMYVLLDVIYNHSGNNWFYEQGGSPQSIVPYRFQPPLPFHSWRSRTGAPIAQPGNTDDAVWPEEFQQLDWYTRAGQIGKWDPESWENPLDPENEFRRGDFFDLKDLNLKDVWQPKDEIRGDVLGGLIRAYQYWISLSDCDGFRIDTVKHVPYEASRNFCGAIHEYAESIGKENFLLLGEVTGGASMARNYLDVFGRNIDAILDIGEPASILAGLVKGFADPASFFNQFRGHDILGSHRQTGRYHVSILDDHDMVGRSPKQRFAAGNTSDRRYEQVAHAVGVQLTTLGIPCIYYGTEQAFDGTEARHDQSLESKGFEDRYIRESMFGGTFGAFETEGCHFFDPASPSYLRIAAIARVREQQDRAGQALRRGRQYLRQTSFLGRPFAMPSPGELVSWSRILYDQEVLVALNTHGGEPRGADVTVDAQLHPDDPNTTMRFLYRSDWTDAQLANPPDQQVPVRYIDGRATVRVDLPPAGMAILA
jgi:glycosidase